jgi:hypothetical protein
METGFILDMATIGLATLAITNRIKAEAPAIASYYYTIIAIIIGAGLYAVSVYAQPVVLGFIFAGLVGAGIFDITKKKDI